MGRLKELFVFVLCTHPQADENKSKIERLKQRYDVRVLTDQDLDTKDLHRDLLYHGQKEAYFAPLDSPNEWEGLLKEFGNGRQTAMTLVMI